MNEIMMFEGHEVEIIWINGEPLFEIYSTGVAIGYVEEKNGVLYARKSRIDKTLENADIKPFLHGGEKYMSESQLYDFMLEARTNKVKPFRKWVTSEVLPDIRKTGTYSICKERSLNPIIASNVAELGRVTKGIMKDQGSAPYKIAEVFKIQCEQFGIRLPEDFVKVPEYEQITLFCSEIGQG